ncbi:MAG: energy-coupling factor ABC transporter permease [Firmicutes bacterium]|nr:energy-coupling factor ABC transporter permease [Bacillota bacterium]
MSHIHLPDGVIPVFWWVIGYIITAAMLAFSFYRTESMGLRRKIPLLGIMSALMLIGQSIPLGFIPFHLNLAILSGIVLGPWLGFIAVFITNLFLAFLGHGGITVVGLNTVIVGTEAILGYLLFNAFRRILVPLPFAAATAVILALIFSITLMVGVVSLSNINPAMVLSERLEGLRRIQAPEARPSISIPRFVIIIAPFAVIGIAIESVVTGLIIRFIEKVRPEIIDYSRVAGGGS